VNGAGSQSLFPVLFISKKQLNLYNSGVQIVLKNNMSDERICMPIATLLWSGILFLLQRGTTGVTIFFGLWAAALVIMLDGVTAVSYEVNRFSGTEEKLIKLDVAKVGVQFTAGAIALFALSALTFFVDFYKDPGANAGLRALFGALPLLISALTAYFMIQR
jgi:hypothetical protein